MAEYSDVLNPRNDLLKNEVDEKKLIEQLMELDSVEQKEKFIIKNSKSESSILSDENRSLTLSEFKKIASHSLVTIGSHTLTHLRLSKVSDQIQAKEIGGSKKELELLINEPVTLFSYPHGGKTAFNTTSKILAKEAGYNYAFAAYSGVVRKNFDPFEIPRIHVGNISAKQLETKLKKII